MNSQMPPLPPVASEKSEAAEMPSLDVPSTPEESEPAPLPAPVMPPPPVVKKPAGESIAPSKPPLPEPVAGKPKPAADSISTNTRKPIPVGPRAIEVVAIRAGVYRKDRRNEGDVFMVSKVEELGSWMKATDPKIQKEHERVMAERKKVLRKAATQASKLDNAADE